jgi:non-ribosomal peptide synthetase component F
MCAKGCYISLQALLDACTDPKELDSLRYIEVGGEALNPSTVFQCRRTARNAKLYTLYG